MDERPPINETIRAKLEEYDVEHRLEEFVNDVSDLVSQGVAMAGALVHDHRGDISAFLEKAAAAVDRSLDHQHTERIDQVRGHLERGVATIAEQRDLDQRAPGEPAEPAGSAAADDAPEAAEPPAPAEPAEPGPDAGSDEERR